MSVHANSVISTSIATYREDLYISLTDKENYCYTQSSLIGTLNPEPGGQIMDEAEVTSLYMSQFGLLNTAIVDWMAYNRQERVYQVVSSLHAAMCVKSLFEIDTDATINAAHADNVFSGGGIFETIINYSISYFDDYTFVLLGGDGTPGSAKLKASALAVSTHADTGEQLNIDTFTRALAMATTPVLHRMMFETVLPVGRPSPNDVIQRIFITLGYKSVYLSLNVGDLTLPASVA